MDRASGSRVREVGIGMTRRVPVHRCSACGKANDSVSMFPDGERELPRAGDLSICLYCGHLAIFMADDLGLRELSDVEKEEAAKDPRIALALKFIKRSKS